MNKNSLSYLLYQGAKYFTSNKIMTLASVGVLSSCLFIIGNFYLISLNLQQNIKTIENNNRVVLYIDDAATDEQVDQLKQTLESTENIASVEYFNKSQALEQYKAMYPGQEELFSGLDEKNPLRRFFSVSLVNIQYFDATLYRLKNIPYVGKVKSSKDAVDKMIEIGSIVKFISYWIMGLMLLASLFIIINTIRLAAFYYRRQINIMKYIGATNWFIRWPFIVQGTIIGLSAGILTYILQKYAYIYVFEAFSAQLSLLQVIEFSKISSKLLLGFILGGMTVGISGSGISIGKYLKV